MKKTKKRTMLEVAHEMAKGLHEINMGENVNYSLYLRAKALEENEGLKTEMDAWDKEFEQDGLSI